MEDRVYELRLALKEAVEIMDGVIRDPAVCNVYKTHYDKEDLKSLASVCW